MPDPLDPIDAILSGFTQPFVRVGGFFGISLGGHLVGGFIHDAPGNFALAMKSGWSTTLRSAFAVDPATVLTTWAGTLARSVAVPLAWPCLAALAWVAFRLRMGDDLFQPFLTLALVQPILSFVVALHSSSLAGIDRAIAIGLLLAFEISTAALVLWWRHTTENAPEVEREPEL